MDEPLDGIRTINFGRIIKFPGNGLKAWQKEQYGKWKISPNRNQDDRKHSK
jgi:hypothetical protein